MRPIPAPGALHIPAVVRDKDLSASAFIFAEGTPGRRLDVAAVERLPAFAPVQRIIGNHLGPAARAVRAIAFDKSEQTNWALGWHQDRTIEVQGRAEVDGFGPWTLKQGRVHVAPPFAILADMLTVRLHFDVVDAENAPLIVAVGSHLHGLLPEDRIGEIVASCAWLTCTAEAGDLWLFATPILHASARAVVPRRRRVLQIDFSRATLPNGLAWPAREAVAPT